MECPTALPDASLLKALFNEWCETPFLVPVNFFCYKKIVGKFALKNIIDIGGFSLFLSFSLPLS